MPLTILPADDVTACIVGGGYEGVRMAKGDTRLSEARGRGTGEVRILRAAERNFAQFGLAGATLAQIAREAGMSTAALHYHFRDKETLYRAVLEHILRLWLEETAVIESGNDPRQALEDYVRAKMRFARIFPEASKIFASEVLGGADRIRPFLEDVLRPLLDIKSTVLEGWCREGKLRPIHPRHLLFLIWGATEFYANFAAEIAAATGASTADAAFMEEATDTIVAIVLEGVLPRHCSMIEQARAKPPAQ
jgi:TetR/AcrR family transcriptional regulator